MEHPMQFIKATREYNTFDCPVPAPYLRKSFVSDIAATATVMIAACGFYELFVNGKRYTKGALSPYINNPDHFIYYDSYEIPLDKGENVIGILLGNGYVNNPGGYVWGFDKASFRSAPMTALSLTYENAAGETVTLQSDASFKTAPSPIRSDDYRFGEVYNANFEIPGWNCKGFDDSAWDNAIETAPPRGELRLCDVDPIVTAEERKPVEIFKDGDSYIYDFGVSDAGVCRLTVKGTPGQKIEMQHGDLLQDGHLNIDNIWFENENSERDKQIVHKDIYFCKGEGTEVYTPTFTYHGFRYVKVDGITAEQATPELLTYMVQHSALQSRGGFSCSSDTVNRLQEITRRSDLSNFFYFPTDCPHREKNGWTADATLSCEQLILNFSPEKNYREWMRNICRAQNEQGALPGIVPTSGWGFAWGNGPAWDCVLVYLPYFTYVYRGETDMIIDSAASFMRYLHYLTTRANADGLLEFGLGDWCHVGGIAPKVPLVLTDTVMAVDIARKMAFLFDAVGMTAQRDFAQSIADRFRTAAREHLIDFDRMTAIGDYQTCQAMCLFYEIFTPDEAPAAFARLLDMIHAADDHIDVGVLGGRVLFHVLSQFGYSDLAFKMIARPDYPSYGNWLERGATTLWENFDPESVSSMNHHFWGDISGWFIKNLAGLQFNPQGNDIHRLDIRPSFVAALDHAEAYYDAPTGMIRSAWKRDGDAILLSLQIPEGMQATAVLPAGFAFADGASTQAVCSGEYKICRV